MKHFFQSKIGRYFLFFCTFLFLFILELNTVGLALREKILITDSLDFSWFSDAIERLLHGYILGRDVTFTYGPVFQYIYSLPSLLLHVPSYVSVAISPIISFVILFSLVVYIAKSLTEHLYEQIAYILFLFLVLGLLISSHTDTVRMLIPVAYTFILYNTIKNKPNIFKICLIAFLPTFFGLYTYNLFITTLILLLMALALDLFINRNNLSVFIRTNWEKLFIFPFTIFFQILFSMLFTHNLNYIYNSLDAVRNYRYVMSLVWTPDRSNVLLIFPLSLIFLGFYLWKTKYVSIQTRNALLLFILASFVQLIYALSRSDAGHLLFALYPSIICFFSIVFFLSQKVRGFIVLAFIFYILVPFKPIFYNTFAPKNIVKVFQVIVKKSNFFTIYSLPQNYYFTQNEVNDITRIIRENKDKVYIYPYDSYILNIENSTFNSFALGLYTYSNALVEENTVKGFTSHPPSFIILMLDTKGALNLDDMPNFTRNPLFAMWMIKNYTVKENHVKYLLLTYAPNKKGTISSTSCEAHILTINLKKKESIFQDMIDSIKPPLYYLGNIRLPYTPSSKNYLIFPAVYSVSGILSLFNLTDNNNSLTQNLKKDLQIIRVSPFLGRKEVKIFHKNEFSFTCALL